MNKLEIYIRDELVETVTNDYDILDRDTCVALNEDVDDGIKSYSIEVYAFGDEVYKCETDADIMFTDVELRYITDV